MNQRKLYKLKILLKEMYLTKTKMNGVITSKIPDQIVGKPCKQDDLKSVRKIAPYFKITGEIRTEAVIEIKAVSLSKKII